MLRHRLKFADGREMPTGPMLDDVCKTLNKVKSKHA